MLQVGKLYRPKIALALWRKASYGPVGSSEEYDGWLEKNQLFLLVEMKVDIEDRRTWIRVWFNDKIAWTALVIHDVTDNFEWCFNEATNEDDKEQQTT